MWLQVKCLILLEYGRNTDEQDTYLGTTGPQMTLKFKRPQTNKH